ncbi:hypothetical protein DFQ26_005435 [Actinomortierella ambigua]|nr:hypothetical protein DFQ26_005435 [Actinomortierella ambigua]
MEYVRLGKTGLRVSRLCLGCLTYGSPEWNGWSKPEKESLVLIKKAYDAGFNFFDTADCYCNGQSELILGKAIKQLNMDRGRIVVATKLMFPVLEDNEPHLMDRETTLKDQRLINKFGLSRKRIFEACDASLQRLGLDYIDLYQIHRLDQDTPIEEIMCALNDLVRSGKVRYIGASSMFAWEFQKANNIAEKNGWTKFVSMQNCYNLIYREEEREVIPYSLDAGIGGLPWSPLARGHLTGKHRKTQRSESSSFDEFKNLEKWEHAIIDRVVELAEKKGVSPTQISLAWLLTKPYVSAPVVGFSSEEHMLDALGALSIKLTDEECQYLEELYVPKPLIPM